jgi:hypothetical protein
MEETIVAYMKMVFQRILSRDLQLSKVTGCMLDETVSSPCWDYYFLLTLTPAELHMQ